eukprot:scaffold100264_cov69-Attheya_sp.AAC.1
MAARVLCRLGRCMCREQWLPGWSDSESVDKYGLCRSDTESVDMSRGRIQSRWTSPHMLEKPMTLVSDSVSVDKSGLCRLDSELVDKSGHARKAYDTCVGRIWSRWTSPDMLEKPMTLV